MRRNFKVTYLMNNYSGRCKCYQKSLSKDLRFCRRHSMVDFQRGTGLKLTPKTVKHILK